MGKHHYWTVQDDATLVHLQAAGKTCAQIAEQLGTSRNAVLHRSSRLRRSSGVPIRPRIKEFGDAAHPLMRFLAIEASEQGLTIEGWAAKASIRGSDIHHMRYQVPTLPVIERLGKALGMKLAFVSDLD